MAEPLRLMMDRLGLDVATAAKQIGTRPVVVSQLLDGGKIRSDSREKVERWLHTVGTADTVQE